MTPSKVKVAILNIVRYMELDDLCHIEWEEVATLASVLITFAQHQTMSERMRFVDNISKRVWKIIHALLFKQERCSDNEALVIVCMNVVEGIISEMEGKNA